MKMDKSLFASFSSEKEDLPSSDRRRLLAGITITLLGVFVFAGSNALALGLAAGEPRYAASRERVTLSPSE